MLDAPGVGAESTRRRTEEEAEQREEEEDPLAMDDRRSRDR